MTKIMLAANTGWYLYNFRRTLAHYLHDKDFEVVVLSPADEYAQKLQDMGFRWIPWEVGRQTLNPFTELLALWQLYRIYKQERPDLVHHHTIKPGLYGTIAARLAGVRGIVNAVTGRGYVFLGDGPKVRLLRWLVSGFYRAAYATPRCAIIFENSTDQAYFTENRLVPESRTYLIESVGVDPDHFYPLPEPEGVPIVLQASRMLWDKGVGVLVEAARLLQQRKVQVRVALVGNPDPGNPTSIPEETLRKWDADGIIEWWGFRPDMNTVYNSSHIVTLPSMYAEGVPTVLIEAAACGRPVVTTTMPGCRDFVAGEAHGFLVPPGNPGALADALEKLVCSQELRVRMGAAGRNLILDKYTTSKINTETFEIYKQLLNSA